jgi:hypothetical protein
MNGKPDIYGKLESSGGNWTVPKGDLCSGNWIGTTFGGSIASGDEIFRVCKRGKNKDCFVNKQ